MFYNNRYPALTFYNIQGS